jgi:hypothetical protein
MNLHEIEKLLDKYFEGETTRSEEEKLREFFASGNVPEQWRKLEAYFSFIDQEKDLRIDDPGFDEKVMARVKESKLSMITDLHRPWIYWMAGIAASVLILVAVFVKFDPFSNRIKDTYNDPQVAYMEAKKILLFVSSKFNQGTRNLEPVSAMETGLKELKPVAVYDKAVNNVERLNQIEKVEKMIINN